MSRAEAWRFFARHAGRSYPAGAGPIEQARERVCVALVLARAEAALAERDDIAIEWADDPEPYEMGDAETVHPNQVLCCTIWRTRTCDRGHTHRDALASLCGIGDPSPQYARVVAAELACEALDVLATEAAS